MDIKINKAEKIKTAIVGAAGYTGFELLKILNKHKFAQVDFATSNTNADKLISDVFPSFLNFQNNQKFISTENLPSSFFKTDVIFLCLPANKSMEFVSNYLNEFKGKIIDIGSDFRLNDFNNYEKWYKKEHCAKNLLKDFVYGLPEINYEEIKNAKNIANPGCYPTSVLLALAPILKNIEDINFSFSYGINIDSKSGVSGAGKKLNEIYLFCSINENFYAYNVLYHRHIGEIEQEIKKICSKDIKVCFTPHLLPIDRGIFTTIYCKINMKKNYNKTIEIINNIFLNFYKNSYFVKFLGQKVPQIKDILYTNFCHIGFAFDERTNILKIFSVIDNLIKGAAGQAVQNMNILFGLPQWEGLG